jgi:hypothetical protein
MSKTYESRFHGTVIITESGQEFTLSNSAFIDAGGEGEVFQLDTRYAVTMYTREISDQLREKLATLCAQRSTFHEMVVSPLQLVRVKGQPKKQVAGFVMRYLPDATSIKTFRWTKSIAGDQEERFDTMIAHFIYDLSDGLANLHSNRVFMADLKPENILVSNHRAYFVDFDSCSLPAYPSTSATIQYVDPELRGGVPNALGPYEFSARSDWWALGVIAFELFIGVSPWSGSNPNMRRDPLEVRSFNYSAVLLDPIVKPPVGYTRPKEWFARREKIRNYFEIGKGIFSKKLNKRVPMTGVLEGYFPRKKELGSSYFVPVNQEMTEDEEFGKQVLEDFRKIAEERGRQREKARVDMLDLMFGSRKR